MGRLSNKVAFVTGTATGQGRAAARLFAAEGAYVVGCDVKAEEAAETLEMVRAAGGQMISMCPIDLADRQSADRWLREGIAQTGGIDILYNNAAAAKFAPIETMSQTDWAFTIRNELDLVFLATQAAWPSMVARGGGVIINTGSSSGLSGDRKLGGSAHSATKGAVIAMTKQMAAEGAPHNIRVNVISPGPVESPASAALGSAIIEAVASTIPLKRWGKPEDVAYCALYLASDEARWITGANFVIDGGLTSIR